MFIHTVMIIYIPITCYKKATFLISYGFNSLLKYQLEF